MLISQTMTLTHTQHETESNFQVINTVQDTVNSADLHVILRSASLCKRKGCCTIYSLNQQCRKQGKNPAGQSLVSRSKPNRLMKALFSRRLSTCSATEKLHFGFRQQLKQSYDGMGAHTHSAMTRQFLHSSADTQQNW